MSRDGRPAAGQFGLSDAGRARLDAHIKSYVDLERIPGALALVALGGEIVHLSTFGLADRERGVAVQPDTIFRIYSMTKPLTAIAVMQLYEQGALQLDDPVHRFIPSWASLRVHESGATPPFRTRQAERPMTVRDLLSHQSGLGYGRPGEDSPIDRAYAERGVLDPTSSLSEMVDKLAGMPLVFSPGTRWKYSIAADVCGHLVELVSGESFDEYLRAHLLDPLGMTDTSFWVTRDKQARLAANYQVSETGGLELIDDPCNSSFCLRPSLSSGGGGLTSTAEDYWRFAQALANGGELEGVRIIGRKTLEMMTANHLTNGADLASVALGRWSETSYRGIGFGLGFSVTLDPVAAQVTGSAGEFSWGGAASTTFLVDPAEQLVFLFLTQLVPSSAYNIRRELRGVLYGALI